jgi:hypothetical protein
MKKLMLLAGVVVLSAFSIAACTPQQQANVASLASIAQEKVTNGCNLMQPVLLDLSASIPGDTNLKTLTDDNGKFCEAIATLDPTNVKSLIDTLIPEAMGLVALLPIDPVTQGTIRVALGAAQLALSNWLQAHGTAVATVAVTAPVSSVLAASSPVASQ